MLRSNESYNIGQFNSAYRESPFSLFISSLKSIWGEYNQLESVFFKYMALVNPVSWVN